eukprot:11174923-Lingulodinium_polyedra.AAC.1
MQLATGLSDDGPGWAAKVRARAEIMAAPPVRTRAAEASVDRESPSFWDPAVALRALVLQSGPGAPWIADCIRTRGAW